jgi:hypothetical protein
MFESLLKSVNASQLLGIRVGTIGLLLVLAGVVIVLVSAHLLGDLPTLTIVGATILYLGMAIGISGVAIHFYIMLKMFVERK